MKEKKGEFRKVICDFSSQNIIYYEFKKLMKNERKRELGIKLVKNTLENFELGIK